MRITLHFDAPKKYRRALNYHYNRDTRPASRDLVATHRERYGDTQDEQIWRRWHNRKQ